MRKLIEMLSIARGSGKAIDLAKGSHEYTGKIINDVKKILKNGN